MAIRIAIEREAKGIKDSRWGSVQRIVVIDLGDARLLGTTKALKADAEHDRETDSHEESTRAALEETPTDRLVVAELSKEILAGCGKMGF